MGRGLELFKIGQVTGGLQHAPSRPEGVPRLTALVELLNTPPAYRVEVEMFNAADWTHGVAHRLPPANGTGISGVGVLIRG